VEISEDTSRGDVAADLRSGSDPAAWRDADGDLDGFEIDAGHAVGFNRREERKPSMDAESMEGLMSAATVPYFLPEGMEMGLRAPQVAYAGWLMVTVALAMTAGMVMLRGWKRRFV
jgi:hypothetical protein